MTVFTLISLAPGPAIAAAIEEHFQNNNIKIADNVWLLAGVGTAQEISNRLGVTPDAKVGNAIVFATSGYYGRGPSNNWEWIKAKLEAPAIG
jgi:hypothetical protein